MLAKWTRHPVMIHANGSVQSNRDPLHAVADVMVGHTPPGCYLPLPPLLALSTLPYQHYLRMHASVSSV